jgi:RNA polymerase sigma factor (sigma-70 family)
MKNALDPLVRHVRALVEIPPECSDGLLLERFAVHGEEKAFRTLVQRHGAMVLAVGRRILHDFQAAEDVFQATFLLLARRAGRLDRRDSVGGWLYTVASRLAFRARSAARRGTRPEQPAPGPNTDPLEELSSRELCGLLDEELRRLPERYRLPLLLCCVEGLARDEAARQLGWTLGQVKAGLERGRELLRRRLERRGVTLSAVLLAAGLVQETVRAALPPLVAATVQFGVACAAGRSEAPAGVLALAEGVTRSSTRVKVATGLLVGLLIPVALLVTGKPPEVAGEAAAPSAPPAVKPADAPTLHAGRWALIEWMAADAPRRMGVVTIGDKDGRKVITAIEAEDFPWKGESLTVVGRRVRFTMNREGALESRFDGLFDPADPTRVLGSLESAGTTERAELDLLPASSKRTIGKPARPAAWLQFVRLAQESMEAEGRVVQRGFKGKPPAEQAALQAAAKAARQKYEEGSARLLRELVAGRPDDPFVYEAVRLLLAEFKRLKPSPTEVDAWLRASRTFATRHGPRFESETVGRFATTLTRHAEYAGQAQRYAVLADSIATRAGLRAGYTARVAEYDVERKAWATQEKPPPPDAIWTVTLTGRVTDAKGRPVADAEVLVNNTRWVKRIIEGEDYKTRTGPDGRYKIVLKCQGTFRLHVTRVWAEKQGYVRVENSERHRLLPGQSATLDFALVPGERFAGTIRLRPAPGEPEDGQHVLEVTGPGVDEFVVTKANRFELTLPRGTYTVTVPRSGGKKLTWSGLKTGPADHTLKEPAFRYTSETVGPAFDELWKTMDRDYSYFTLKPDLNWQKLRDEYRSKAAAARSADELAGVLKEMLGRLRDGHVWIEMPDGKTIGTYGKAWSYNGNREVVRASLTDVTELGGYALVGKTKADGFGYFLMLHQSEATPELVAKAVAAIEKLADCPGFVVDLRTANGGSEPLAREVARLFCGRSVVYAKSRFRNGPEHDDFTEDYPRELPAAKSGKPFTRPVVCLLGPGCVSSGEGFAKMMTALPQVTTVGLPTAGSSGNPGPARVGDSGLTVYFSRWVDLLPDGTPIEGRGVVPKVRVDEPAEAYRKGDPTLARGLEVLRGKVKAEKRP